MKQHELDALLDNLKHVNKTVPASISNPQLDTQERASIEVATVAAPETIRRWVRLAGGMVTKMERRGGVGVWHVELDWR